jgi:hypothetical protein
MPVISSVGYSDKDIITSIIELHNNGQNFELDPCYSIGNFYKTTGIAVPKYRFDINPQVAGVIQADVKNIPLPANSIRSVIFDPPFMFGTHGQTKNYQMTKRFSMFDSFDELQNMYVGALKEFSRILVKNGIVAFKCQDYTDSKTTMTHALVYQWATDLGFYAKDLFILVFGARIYNSTLKQKHARKFHSYWWIFQNKNN